MPKLSEKHISDVCGYQGAGPVTWLLSVQSTCLSQGLSMVGQRNASAAVGAPCKRFALVCGVISVLPGRYTLTLASPWSRVLRVCKCMVSGQGLHWGLSLVLHVG